MEKKISVVIPNYNGRDLLLKNLPSVIRHCFGCEIILVDDASEDDSVSLVRKKFKKVKVITLAKNVGFARAANLGVKKARGDLILLLNSDVSPKEGFLKPALNYFKKDPLNTFAVGLCDLSHEDGKIIPRGRGGANFTKGFLKHYAAHPERGETLWVSGGSGLFDRQKFLNLGGFDVLFAPFYWEDIDLCFKAWRVGLTCLFEPLSKVDHFHESGAIKKSRSQFFVKTVSYKNQFIFVWKNINDYILIIQHILWLPYHFISALIKLDLAFFAGFFWAIFTIGELILRYDPATIFYKLTEREVLEKFEK